MLDRIRALLGRFSHTQKIVMLFAIIITIGTILLMTPFATRDGQGASWINALFSAASATCVTGLTPVDTYGYWSEFGQVVILLLIQIGGLGFMTFAMVFSFALRRSIGLRDRLLLSQSFNFDTHVGVVRIVRLILKGTLLIEGIGAVLLSIRFVPQFGWGNGIYKGIFHSVSAFCNAGFDLMGQIEPLSSLTHYASDPLVSLTISFLIIIGGIGFFVWSDILSMIDKKRKTVLSMHTKVVLLMTGILLVGGTLLIFLFEFNNPGTMGNQSVGEKLLQSFFQSVTFRTAGFNSVDMASLSKASIALSIVLMFIGASSGSTGGGIKTTTFASILLATRSVIKGQEDVNIWGRRLDKGVVSRSIAITVLALLVVFVGTILICVFQPELTLTSVIFEVVSAFGTVGVSMGVTPGLEVASKITIVIIMLAGRVGILTVAFALAKRNQNYKTMYRYPNQKIMVG